MAASSAHFKLGLFTLLAIVAAVLAAFGLGLHGVRAKTTAFHTYFDESVQGLDVGAPVKYRGVPIGTIDGIAVAKDDRHVEVVMGLNRERVQALGLVKSAPTLRAQLGTQGITGVKFVDIDIFDPKLYPAPALPFPPAEPYIPAAPSVLDAMVKNLATVGQQLPALVDVMTSTLRKVDDVLGDMKDQRLAERVAKLIDGVDATVADLHRTVGQLDRARIPEKTAAALDNLSDALAKVNGVLDQVGGDGGLVASTQRASNAIDELGRTTTSSAREAGQTLRDLDQAAQALRTLADAVDRDPQMLLVGHAQVREP